MSKQTKGLAGVVAGESQISTVGTGGGLNYRGFSIEELCEKCNFEQVAYLLLYKRFPNGNELNGFMDRINSYRGLNETLKQLLRSLKSSANAMDVCRTVVSLLGIQNPEDPDFKNQNDIPLIVLGSLGPSICYWWHYSRTGKEIDLSSRSEESIAYNFLRLLRYDNKPIPALDVKTMDVSLILYAEHDFNASTFACRVTASTLSDLYSCLCTGIGTLKGKLHGGANEAAMEYLGNLKTIEEADHFLNNNFKNKALIMGFGHRVYKNGDPRHHIIKDYSKKLSETEYGKPQLYKISDHIEQRMVNEKKIHPNLDFFSASAYYQLRIPIQLFTPIFVISRTTGWVAHVYEQRAKNTLIRPRSNYTGPLNLKVDEFMPKL